MTDVRESILARLVEIADGVSGVATAQRNPRQIDDIALPAILIFDADEQVVDGESLMSKPNTSPAPLFIRQTMLPEILIKVSGLPEDVGGALNLLRSAFVKAVLTDGSLAALTTNGGAIRYLGCATQLGHGRQMIGEMAVSIGLTYVLRPADL